MYKKQPTCQLCGRDRYKWGGLNTITDKHYCDRCTENGILTSSKFRRWGYIKWLKWTGKIKKY